MAQNGYIGVNGVACEVDKLYIGIDGVAREIEKAYIGVNGVATLWHENKIVVPEGMYLTFSSENAFTMSVAKPRWDGKLLYSKDTINWTEWNGSKISGTDLYFCGIGNTKITGKNDVTYSWTIIGSNVACRGNIETLLDYATVKAGEHPKMSIHCYYKMFAGCTSLTTAPELPATTLRDSCYEDMFQDCTSLTIAPSLPATSISLSCYNAMFKGCTSLTAIPKLPATTLRIACYASMFQGCTAIKFSNTETEEYTQAYRIPTSGTGETATNALLGMFLNVGGTITDATPTINTTYYLHKDCSIV